ncbi:MAG: dephospho-CoA kinase [Gammaproteobacteria bacterium]|nr:dephospho-CoA kinase [Gammaproteobacteria bacterium]NNL06110.1 dephospho-CoA kinase [Gammaproteobacteria bacterium]
MLTVGLTGGIGSGKTAVADMFNELGVVVIDADVIAHLAVQPGTDALDEIVDTFGETILTIGGEIDRARLADIVFNKPELRKKLETIIHPRVRAQIRAQKQAHNNEPYILVVIPLLLESGQRDLVDRVLVVNAAESTRIDRVKARDGRSEQQIRAIMQNQADDAQRSAAADDRIDNNGSLDQLRQQVDALHRNYSRMARQHNFM